MAIAAIGLERNAHIQATGQPIAKIVAYLQEVLGTRLTAVIAGTSDGKAVSQWAKGTRRPYPDTETRLRHAYQVVMLMIPTESAETIRAWFIGMNPELDDESPALAIADDPKGVLEAARFYLAHG